MNTIINRNSRLLLNEWFQSKKVEVLKFIIKEFSEDYIEIVDSLIIRWKTE